MLTFLRGLCLRPASPEGHFSLPAPLREDSTVFKAARAGDREPGLFDTAASLFPLGLVVEPPAHLGSPPLSLGWGVNSAGAGLRPGWRLFVLHVW